MTGPRDRASPTAGRRRRRAAGERRSVGLTGSGDGTGRGEDGGTGRAPASVASMALPPRARALVLAACGSDNAGQSQSGGEIFGRSPQLGTGATAIGHDPGAPALLLAAAAGTGADHARRRPPMSCAGAWRRMGVADADVTTSSEGVVVQLVAPTATSSAPPPSMHADEHRCRRIDVPSGPVPGARQPVGRCRRRAASRPRPDARPRTDAIGDGVQVVAASGAGWKLTVHGGREQVPGLPQPHSPPGGSSSLAVVSDGSRRARRWAPASPRCQSAVGPPLAEETRLASPPPRWS